MNAAAMRADRIRADQERRDAAIRRVQAFEAWSRRSGLSSEIPEIPTDGDYRAARAAGARGVRP